MEAQTSKYLHSASPVYHPYHLLTTPPFRQETSWNHGYYFAGGSFSHSQHKGKAATGTSCARSFLRIILKTFTPAKFFQDRLNAAGAADGWAFKVKKSSHFFFRKVPSHVKRYNIPSNQVRSCRKNKCSQSIMLVSEYKGITTCWNETIYLPISRCNLIYYITI